MSNQKHLLNLVSNDVFRFELWGVFAVFIWETYLELIAIFLILVYLLGIFPALAGVGTSLLLIPLQLYIAKQFAQERTHTAQETDNRVRHTSEVIEGITSVKSFGWELPFTKLIGTFRSSEATFIHRSQVLRAINQGIYYCGGTIANFATFSVFWAEGKLITVPIVFSTLSMMQVLKATMNRQYTQCIEAGSEAAASCQRIDNFLELPNKPLEEPFNGTPDHGVPMSALLEIENGAFCYGEGTSEPVLRDINIQVDRGELVIIVGRVGSGKSSCLNAILGEMTVASSVGSRHGRRIHPSTRIAYCQQRPWILASSVKQNIVIAGAGDSDVTVDEELYRLAVESCCIVQDMLQWPAYDNTEIGERGVSVSGGQKARIALARAVYSDADLYVLDDPLSAVDAMVSKSLFMGCIVNALKRRGKGIILATHQLQYLQYADKIIVLNKEGRQCFYGSYEAFQDKSFEFMGALSTSMKTTRSAQDLTLSLSAAAAEDAVEGAPADGSPVDSSSSSSNGGVRYDASMRVAREEETAEQEERRQIIQKEVRLPYKLGDDCNGCLH